MAYAGRLVTEIYGRSPHWVRSLAVNAHALRTYRKRFGGVFVKSLHELEETQSRPTEALVASSRDAAAALARRAIATCAAYRDLVGSDEFRNWSALPLLSKSFVRERGEALRDEGVLSSGKVLVRHTSGTTGTPLRLYQTLQAVQRENAFTWQHRSWHGCPHGTRTLTVAGHPVIPTRRRKPPFWVRNYRENQLFLSSFHLAPSSFAPSARAVADFAPAFIHGYPSAVALVAQAVLEAGVQVSPRAVITASETLLAHQREKIKSAFGVEARMWYGNTELAGNIVECPQGRLHVREEHSFVEFLRDDGTSASPGETARLVATPLSYPAMFLLRYDTGDQVIPSERELCECGRPGRLVEAVLGRVEDYVIDGEGRLIGRLDHLFKEARGVREAQIVQDVPGEVKLRIVLGDAEPKALEQVVRDEARMRFSPNTRLTFEYVRELERNASGKAPFIKVRKGIS